MSRNRNFAESKKAKEGQDGNNGGYSDAGDGFMNIRTESTKNSLSIRCGGGWKHGIRGKVKNVISKLRAAGKTEKEVHEIIEQAAEAGNGLKRRNIRSIRRKSRQAGGENLQDAL